MQDARDPARNSDGSQEPFLNKMVTGADFKDFTSKLPRYGSGGLLIAIRLGVAWGRVGLAALFVDLRWGAFSSGRGIPLRRGKS